MLQEDTNAEGPSKLSEDDQPGLKAISNFVPKEPETNKSAQELLVEEMLNFDKELSSLNTKSNAMGNQQGSYKKNPNYSKKNSHSKTIGSSGVSFYSHLLKLDTVKSAVLFLVRLHANRRRRLHLLDSWVMFLHYRIACLFFLIAAIGIRFQWYIEDEIVCVKSFNAEENVKDYMMNICLSYSWHTMANGSSRVLFFYRWSSYLFLLLAQAFYLPRLLMKRIGDPRPNRVFADLLDRNPSFAAHTIVSSYLSRNVGIHGYTYLSFVALHFASLCVSISAVLFIDFTLQGEFVGLMWGSFPFSRDPMSFRDPLSLAFPPFVNCTIGPGTGMAAGRQELLHCHLTLMEVLEKVFLLSWLILSTICLISVAFLIALLLLPLVPALKAWLFRRGLRYCSQRVRLHLLSRLGAGDVLFLWATREYLTNVEFGRVFATTGELLLNKTTRSEAEIAAIG